MSSPHAFHARRPALTVLALRLSYKPSTFSYPSSPTDPLSSCNVGHRPVSPHSACCHHALPPSFSGLVCSFTAHVKWYMPRVDAQSRDATTAPHGPHPTAQEPLLGFGRRRSSSKLMTARFTQPVSAGGRGQRRGARFATRTAAVLTACSGHGRHDRRTHVQSALHV